ncbi:PilZ domain-containing protein [Reinekea sp.]|uniref:PilZ domain-containing protein n=1 Tax=Reinekea sp. TaxID=1970455 RepID=UPI002A82D831|nr:PilZ domain-containing protein [Reinekea sp.]
MDPSLLNDRRDSFRVEMNAMVSIVSLDDTRVIDASDCFPQLHAIALQSQSDVIEQEIGLISERIKDIAVRKTLDLLQQKIALMAKLIDVQTAQANSLKTQLIDISIGGCSVTLPDLLQINDRLALALIFTPSYFSLFTLATVSAHSEQGGLQKYHLNFGDLLEAQHQTLLKLMFKAQTNLIKT